MSCKLEPAIWSRDTGQRIPCFDTCQLIITWMSNIEEENSKPRLHISVKPLFGVWPPCCATPPSSSPRPRAIPLAMITMRKSTHGFPFVSHMSMGLCLAALRAVGAPLLSYCEHLTLVPERECLSTNRPPHLALRRDLLRSLLKENNLFSHFWNLQVWFLEAEYCCDTLASHPREKGASGNIPR